MQEGVDSRQISALPASVATAATEAYVWDASVLRQPLTFNKMLSYFLFRRTQSTYFQVQDAARTFLVGLGLDPQMYLVYGEDDLLVSCWMSTDEFDAFCGEMVRQYRDFKAYRYDKVHYVSAQSIDGGVGPGSDDLGQSKESTRLLETAIELANSGQLHFDASDDRFRQMIESQLLIPFEESRRGILLFIVIEPLSAIHVPGDDLLHTLRDHYLTGSDPRFSEIVLHVGQPESGPFVIDAPLQPERYLVRCVSSEYERMHEIVQSTIGNVVEPCGYWTRTLIVAKSLSGPRLQAVRMSRAATSI
jgi:hypothetical protein